MREDAFKVEDLTLGMSPTLTQASLLKERRSSGRRLEELAGKEKRDLVNAGGTSDQCLMRTEISQVG